MNDDNFYHCSFNYGNWDKAYIPWKNIMKIVEPVSSEKHVTSEVDMITKSLRNPLGSKRLAEMVLGRSRILILVDDYTRLTPAHLILPLILEELKEGCIPRESVTILIASGTHRSMSVEEKMAKCGSKILDTIPVKDHVWYGADTLASLGTTDSGIKIEVNKMLLDADFIIGLGHIVPHRVAGYSGGAKIVQPGVCGDITTGQTHWLSARDFSGKEIMGVADNPIRREIDEVGLRAGLKFIVNTVQTGDGRIHSCHSGDPIEAHKSGCEEARTVYGSTIPSLADMVISDSYPANTNMWQASKGIYSADLALKEDGVLILVTSCPEGVSQEHPEVAKYGYKISDRVEKMVENGEIEDLTIAAHLLHVGRVICGKRNAILVSPGIPKDVAEQLGFFWAPDLAHAVDEGFRIKGPDASVIVLCHGGEVMPICE